MKKYSKPELNLSNITANQTIATTLVQALFGSSFSFSSVEEIMITVVQMVSLDAVTMSTLF